MRNVVLIAISLFLCTSTSCQSNLSRTLNVNRYFTNNNDSVYFATFEFVNTGNSDIVIWIGENQNQDEKQYFLKRKKDFSLSELIYQRLLSADEMIIGQSFLKKLKPLEKLRFHVFLNEDKSEQAQITKFENLVKSSQFSDILMKYKFDIEFFPSYQGNDIIIFL